MSTRTLAGFGSRHFKMLSSAAARQRNLGEWASDKPLEPRRDAVHGIGPWVLQFLWCFRRRFHPFERLASPCRFSDWFTANDLPSRNYSNHSAMLLTRPSGYLQASASQGDFQTFCCKRDRQEVAKHSRILFCLNQSLRWGPWVRPDLDCLRGCLSLLTRTRRNGLPYIRGANRKTGTLQQRTLKLHEMGYTVIRHLW